MQTYIHALLHTYTHMSIGKEEWEKRLQSRMNIIKIWRKQINTNTAVLTTQFKNTHSCNLEIFKAQSDFWGEKTAFGFLEG